jgi:hypothetical protein
MTRKRTSEKDLVVSAAAASAPARSRKAPARPRGQRDIEPANSLASAVTEAEIVAPQAETVVSTQTPTYEEIAKLAYSYWEARGYQGGSAEEDWTRAEQELRVNVSAAIA